MEWQKLEGISLASDRLSRLSCFESQAYRGRYPDIGDADPCRHFVSFGSREGRIAARPLHVARLIGQCKLDLEARPPPAVEWVQRSAPGSFAVFCSSFGNAFMKEIAVALSQTLRAAGHSVVELDETHPIDGKRPTSIFVAPHEFFLLGKGPSWLRDDVLSEAFMYCTEQPQTKWFWEILPTVLMARGVIDISPLTADLLSEVMPAVGIQPFPFRSGKKFSQAEMSHPLLQARRHQLDWSSDVQPYPRRPIDLSFMGAVSDNRNTFFYRNARLFSDFESFIYLRKRNANRVLSTEIDHIDLSAIGSVIARNTKISLNVHRDELPYFEWHRMISQAMANGSLVLSEPCFADNHYIAGHHYLAEESRYMGQMIDWLLRTEDGLRTAEETVHRAAALLGGELTPSSIAERLVGFMARAAR